MAVVFDPDKCSMCQSCIDVCPSEALETDGSTIIVIAEKCADCGDCVDQCPSEALTLPS